MISLKSFRRITSNNSFIPEIDGLRFIAIITVIFLHTNTNFKRVYADSIPDWYINSWIDTIFKTSGIGVDIFFSISGFILGLPFARYYLLGERKVNLKNYFIRRLTRLEPPYLVSLAALFVLYVLFFGESWWGLFDNFVASVFYSHFFIYGEWNSINPVTWSLETEVQFYVLAPLISSLLFIKNANLRRWLIPATIVLLDFTVPYMKEGLMQYHLQKSIIMYLHSFLVGFAFVDLYLFGLEKIKKSYLWDVLGILAFVVIYNFHPDTVAYQRIYFDMAVFTLFISVFRGNVFNYIFTREFIVVVGGMCYTIYLLHYPVLFVIMKYFSKLHITGFVPTIIANFIVAIVSLLAVSAIFFKLVEQPCMDKNWPQKFRDYFKQKISISNDKH
jgi:peptidoglycan/LPS O-acetylase OafA/YrhL